MEDPLPMYAPRDDAFEEERMTMLEEGDAMRVSPTWPSSTSATAMTQTLCDMADMWTPTTQKLCDVTDMWTLMTPDQRAGFNADTFRNVGLDCIKF